MAEFAAGLILGVVAGFFLYPLYWSWIAWREHQEASRRARRIDDVLADMKAGSERRHSRREGDGRSSGPRHLRTIGR
jgi:hypothetical protein